MKDRYLICSDLDGTLLNSKGKISENTLSLIRDLQSEGHIFCISTGRMYKSAKHFAGIISDKTSVICSNGAYVCAQEKEIYKNTMNQDTAIQVFNLMQSFDLSLSFFSKDNTYYSKPISVFFSPEDLRRISNGDTIDGMKPILNLDIFKQHLDDYLNAIVIEEENFELLEEARKKLKQLDGVSIQSSHFNNIEIIPEGTDKGQAVKKLQEFFDIKIENVIAFGDGENDITMLKYAGTGIAMDNASNIVKKSADIVTLNNDSEGVYYSLKKIFNK